MYNPKKESITENRIIGGSMKMDNRWRTGITTPIGTKNLSIDCSKYNILEHVLYEFEMYLLTYERIDPQNDELIKNVFCECHALHLRNIIHFFSGEDSLSYKALFEDPICLGVKEKEKKKKIISQAVSHLTIERCSEKQRDIHSELKKLIQSEYEEMKCRIEKTVDLIDSGENMKDNCQKDESIQSMIDYIRSII